MNYNDGLSASDVALLSGRGGNNGSWGDNGSWWIILFLIFAFAGFGNRGWGGNDGGNGGTNPMYIPYMVGNTGVYSAPASQTNLTDAFSFNTLNNDVRSIQSSLCNGFAGVTNAINDASRANLECCCNVRSDIAQQGFNTVTAINATGNALGMGMINGFNDVNRGIQQNGFNTQECCCDIKTNIADLKYTVATENCQDRAVLQEGIRDIITSNTANTQAILDKLCQQEIDAKNDLIANLRSQLNMADLKASQTAQNAFISQGFANEVDALYNRLNNCPVPSTPVYGRTPIFTCNGNNNVGGCGCNCGNF